MTKEELKKICEQYHVDIERDHITGTPKVLYISTDGSDKEIPELEAICGKKHTGPVYVASNAGFLREAQGCCLYEVFCPKDWFDGLFCDDYHNQTAQPQREAPQQTGTTIDTHGLTMKNLESAAEATQCLKFGEKPIVEVCYNLITGEIHTKYFERLTEEWHSGWAWSLKGPVISFNEVSPVSEQTISDDIAAYTELIQSHSHDGAVRAGYSEDVIEAVAKLPKIKKIY